MICGEELAKRLKADVRISNQGHPGPLVFPVMLGTNDSAGKGPNGSPVSAANYETNLRRMIDDLLGSFPGGEGVGEQPDLVFGEHAEHVGV